jgi:GNAT superfamily N-acetyltransferase
VIRSGDPGEQAALEDLMRRSSNAWEAYREDLAAHPEVIEVPAEALDAGRVRVASGEDGRLLGFSVVAPVAGGACELDGLFVDPEAMRSGVGRALVEDVAQRARAEGACVVEVTAGPEGRGFYERVGFVAGEPVQTRFGPALRMRLGV